jgi:hypothetical protein
VRGRPTTRFGRALFLEPGVVLMGSLALEMDGDVDISSSRSGEGDAFRFLEVPAVDTVQVSRATKTLNLKVAHLICWARVGCARGSVGEQAAWPRNSSCLSARYRELVVV